jgi:ketopantoate reductase
VVGTVYGAHLAAGGDSVSVLEHGTRTAFIAAHGLIARDVSDGHLTSAPVDVVAGPGAGTYDLVVVAVTRDQCTAACASMHGLTGAPPILLLGNNAGRADVPEAMLPQVRLGFPGVGGVLVEGIAEYVLIKPQPTALESAGEPRLDELAGHLISRGFTVQREADMEGWLHYHAVLVACICSALGRCGNDTQRLAGDRSTLRLMCAAITEGFASLRRQGARGLPGNLRFLHSRLLSPVAVAYWGRTMRSRNGELWFGAHARHAGSETVALSRDVLTRLGAGDAAARLRELLKQE